MKALLKSVSRSFYLTIRFLPRPLRQPVGLAYLLARATDTIADTSKIPAEIRLTTLAQLARVIAGGTEWSALAEPLREFAAQQDDRAERRLIENLEQVIEQLRNSNAADRHDIRAVLGTIVRGQELDLKRFGDPVRMRSLQTAAELDEYTYLVAGCVGDFWTRLGFRNCPPFADRAPEEMSRLGVDYGKGLQLINVLRDRGADRAAGRNYLPVDEPEAASWLEKAERRIDAGIEYSSALTNWRIRFATALPALIGARTLALLREAGEEAEARKIKVTRPEIRRILAAALLASASPIALRALHQRLSRKL